MERVVEIGGWEHECCGRAYERGDRVELDCIRSQGAGDIAQLVESHHITRTTTKVRGRVTAISIVHADGSESPILRLPSGTALCGFDDDDDGHLEDPWTSAPVENDSSEFRLTVVDRR